MIACLAWFWTHTVTEHEDGTITVSPSILCSAGEECSRRMEAEALYHGWLERGVEGGMIPTVEELKKLAANVDFIDACVTNCADCEWRLDRKDCRDLAQEELERLGVRRGRQ